MSGYSPMLGYHFSTEEQRIEMEQKAIYDQLKKQNELMEKQNNTSGNTNRNYSGDYNNYAFYSTRTLTRSEKIRRRIAILMLLTIIPIWCICGITAPADFIVSCIVPGVLTGIILFSCIFILP